jgi:nucleotide-binding universal stress UspA family protein
MGAADMYKKLLVPVEDSLFGAELVGEAVELAAAWGAHVVFFHAVPDEASVLGDAGLLHAMAPTQFVQKYEWAQRTVVARAQVAARALGVESTGVSRPAKGPLHNCIVQTAQENDCDIIAMSTHGPSLSRLMTHASVGAKLLTHSPVPVLFVVAGGAGKTPMRRAIAQLRDEHRSLGVIVQGLSGLLAQARDSVNAALDTVVVGAALHYLGEFSGRLHHSNEESVLFPRLLAKCPEIAKQLVSLQAEHARETELLQIAEDALVRAKSMNFQMRIPRDGGHDSMLMADSVPA